MNKFLKKIVIMALIKCPECGNLVSDHATSCPKCGFPVDKMKQQAEQAEVQQPVEHKEPVNPTPAPSLTPKSQEDDECHKLIAGIESLLNEHRYREAKDLVDSARAKYPSSMRLIQLSSEIEGKLRSKRNGRVTLVVIFVLCVLAGCAYMAYHQNQAAKEDTAWQVACDSNTVTAYQGFMTDYPNGKHYTEALQRFQGLKGNDESYWQGVASSPNTMDFQNYLKKFPNGAYAALATNKIDSIDYVSATKKNTPDAYEAYLMAHPEGVYAQQAREQTSKIQATAITPEEVQGVKDLMSSYYSAYQNKDIDGITSYFNHVTRRYYNKSNATHDDIVNELKKAFNEDIKSLDIEVESSSFKVKKDESKNFSANFYVVVNVERVDPTKNSSVRSAITATVDSNNKITSITSRKISKE